MPIDNDPLDDLLDDVLETLVYGKPRKTLTPEEFYDKIVELSDEVKDFSFVCSGFRLYDEDGDTLVEISLIMEKNK